MESESTFVAPEGVYSVTEEHKNIPTPHNPNNAPILFPTKVTSIVVRFPPPKQGGTPGLAQLLGGNKEHRKEKSLKDREDVVSVSSSDTPDETFDQTNNTSTLETVPTTPSLDTHTLFSNPTPSKKKNVSRPKHSIRTTSSTFITRLQSNEGLSKAVQSRQGETTFLFYNIAKSFFWIEVGSKAKDPLARVTFSAYPTCHDVNILTASPERMDVVIGFNTGDLMWLDPVSSRYARLNKQGCISNSPCTAVRWVPSSSTLFLVSHADGTIIVYDKEREDGVFTPQDPPITSQASESNGSPPSSQERVTQTHWNPLDNIFVTVPPWHPAPSAAGLGGRPDKEKAARNPVSHWRVSRMSVVDFVFSPDVKYVAAISEDGCLRIIDALAEQLVDCYASYFGSLTCVTWSPDGRFILTGGQDDLLTIFSPWEQRVVARCQGHSSFVAAVAFDDLRCDGRTYRLGSVGEDNKLILWDFSSGALHRPKYHATHNQRMSMSSTISLAFRRDRSAQYLPSVASPGVESSPLPRYHPAPSRNEVAVVQPVLIKHMENDLPTDMSFLPRALLTSTKSGHIKLWIRPLALRGKHTKHTRGQSLADMQDLIS